MAIDGFLLCWYILTALSVLYLLYDVITNTPCMWVMALAWVLVLLYTGPLGLFFFLISCRQPMRGTHDQFINARWKQALGSEIHCVAGDATAIIIAAAILHYFSLPNGIESLIEYAAAWIFGLLIFQALFMITMFPNYWSAVKNTIFAETVSMNLVMTGMIPTVLVIKGLYPIASDPGRPYFWGMMSLATIIAFILGYPINWWLVKRGLKHGMMSRPQSSDKHQMNDHQEHHMHHEPAKIGFARGLWHVVWSYAVLIIVIWLISFWVPIHFS